MERLRKAKEVYLKYNNTEALGIEFVFENGDKTYVQFPKETLK